MPACLAASPRGKGRHPGQSGPPLAERWALCPALAAPPASDDCGQLVSRRPAHQPASPPACGGERQQAVTAKAASWPVAQRGKPGPRPHLCLCRARCSTRALASPRPRMWTSGTGWWRAATSASSKSGVRSRAEQPLHACGAERRRHPTRRHHARCAPAATPGEHHCCLAAPPARTPSLPCPASLSCTLAELVSCCSLPAPLPCCPKPRLPPSLPSKHAGQGLMPLPQCAAPALVLDHPRPSDCL